MKIGYSFWGFLSDIKLDKNYNLMSTPDGNAYYSWAIISEFQKNNYDIIAIYPNRDKYAYSKYGEECFASWGKDIKNKSYLNTSYLNYPDTNLSELTENDIFMLWNKNHLYDVKFILHEWRMQIPNRNLIEEKNKDFWQPDLFLQQCLLKYCKLHNIKLLVFDLDNTITEKDISSFPTNFQFVEIGELWQHSKHGSIHIDIPFNFDIINTFTINDNPTTNLIYVGNRYERDWCIDKYIPTNLNDVLIYGNWLEGGRNSAEKWPLLKFGKRIQQKDMFNIYNKAVCTILLAKKDYCENKIMTGRIIESILYGTIPLFICEYGEKQLNKFANKYKDLLVVHNSNEVIEKINYFKNNIDKRREVIEYLRSYLGTFMDSKYFVDRILKGIKK